MAEAFHNIAVSMMQKADISITRRRPTAASQPGAPPEQPPAPSRNSAGPATPEPARPPSRQSRLGAGLKSPEPRRASSRQSRIGSDLLTPEPPNAPSRSGSLSAAAADVRPLSVAQLRKSRGRLHSPRRRAKRDNSHYAEALGLLRKEQWERAVVLFAAALRACPADGRALLSRSRCYVQLGQFDAAIADADALIELERKENDADERRRRGGLTSPQKPSSAASPLSSAGPASMLSELGSDASAYDGGEGHSAHQLRCRGLLQKASTLYAAGEFELALVYYHRGHRARPDMRQFKDGILKGEAAIQRCVGTRSSPPGVPHRPGGQGQTPRGQVHTPQQPLGSPQTAILPRSAAAAAASPAPPAASEQAADDVDLFGEKAGLRFVSPFVEVVAPGSDKSDSAHEAVMREATTNKELPDFREDVTLLLDLMKDPAFSNNANLNNVFPNRCQPGHAAGVRWREKAQAVAADAEAEAHADAGRNWRKVPPPPPRLLQLNNNNHPANLDIYTGCPGGRKAARKRALASAPEQKAGIPSDDAEYLSPTNAGAGRGRGPLHAPGARAARRSPAAPAQPGGRRAVRSSGRRAVPRSPPRQRPAAGGRRARRRQPSGPSRSPPAPPSGGQKRVRAHFPHQDFLPPDTQQSAAPPPRTRGGGGAPGRRLAHGASVAARAYRVPRKQPGPNINKTKHLWTLQPQDRLSWQHNDRARGLLRETIRYLHKRRSFWQRRSDRDEGAAGEEDDEPRAQRGRRLPLPTVQGSFLGSTAAQHHRERAVVEPKRPTDRPPGWACPMTPVPPAERFGGAGVSTLDVEFRGGEPSPTYTQRTFFYGGGETLRCAVRNASRASSPAPGRASVTPPPGAREGLARPVSTDAGVTQGGSSPVKGPRKSYPGIGSPPSPDSGSSDAADSPRSPLTRPPSAVPRPRSAPPVIHHPERTLRPEQIERPLTAASQRVGRFGRAADDSPPPPFMLWGLLPEGRPRGPQPPSPAALGLAAALPAGGPRQPAGSPTGPRRPSTSLARKSQWRTGGSPVAPGYIPRRPASADAVEPLAPRLQTGARIDVPLSVVRALARKAEPAGGADRKKRPAPPLAPHCLAAPVPAPRRAGGATPSSPGGSSQSAPASPSGGDDSGSEDQLLTEAARLALARAADETAMAAAPVAGADSAECVSALTRTPDMLPREVSAALGVRRQSTRRKSVAVAPAARDSRPGGAQQRGPAAARKLYDWRAELDRESDSGESAPGEHSGGGRDSSDDTDSCESGAPERVRLAQQRNTQWVVQQLSRVYRLLDDGDVQEAVAAATLLLSQLGNLVTRNSRDNTRVAAALYDLCGTYSLRMRDYAAARDFFTKQVVVCKESGRRAGYKRAVAQLAAAFQAGGVDLLVSKRIIDPAEPSNSPRDRL
eukprot:TRINITY_DN12741_c0_g1_i1.p1 TRINITY_DN12741_c0_g1~~TRINITY_DN12741_c0_g1_i1.p1  ORF type:complete len:1424 (+),score=315.67 TRINITY_DN12741_c0_g1_i1:87-4274(+)